MLSGPPASWAGNLVRMQGALAFLCSLFCFSPLLPPFPPLANVPPSLHGAYPPTLCLQTGVSGSLVSFLMLRENLTVWLSLLKPASSPSPVASHSWPDSSSNSQQRPAKEASGPAPLSRGFVGCDPLRGAEGQAGSDRGH